jgi:hypothetical protein
MPKSQSVIGSIKSQILKTVEGRKFCSVPEMVDELRKSGVFDADFAALVVAYMEKDLVRQVMRRKGADGYPLFPNIVITDAHSGRKRRVYMKERHMKPPQYRHVADFWIGYSDYGKTLANETVRRCNTRYETQWELPFPEPDEPDVK